MDNKYDLLGSKGISLSRRKMLIMSAALIGSGLAVSTVPAFGIAPATDTYSQFMQLSGLLVNHQLNEQVGRRMMDLLLQENAQLPSGLVQILAIAEKNNAKEVEDFFSAIPEGPLSDLAHKIIFGWYAGCLEPTRTAKSFAYEEALTFKLTNDVITIPSFGFSGPNNWTRPNAPVLPIPQF